MLPNWRFSFFLFCAVCFYCPRPSHAQLPDSVRLWSVYLDPCLTGTDIPQDLGAYLGTSRYVNRSLTVSLHVGTRAWHSDASSVDGTERLHVRSIDFGIDAMAPAPWSSIRFLSAFGGIKVTRLLSLSQMDGKVLPLALGPSFLMFELGLLARLVIAQNILARASYGVDKPLSGDIPVSGVQLGNQGHGVASAGIEFVF